MLFLYNAQLRRGLRTLRRSETLLMFLLGRDAMTIAYSGRFFCAEERSGAGGLRLHKEIVYGLAGGAEA